MRCVLFFICFNESVRVCYFVSSLLIPYLLARNCSQKDTNPYDNWISLFLLSVVMMDAVNGIPVFNMV